MPMVFVTAFITVSNCIGGAHQESDIELTTAAFKHIADTDASEFIANQLKKKDPLKPFVFLGYIDESGNRTDVEDSLLITLRPVFTNIGAQDVIQQSTARITSESVYHADNLLKHIPAILLCVSGDVQDEESVHRADKNHATVKTAIYLSTNPFQMSYILEYDYEEVRWKVKDISDTRTEWGARANLLVSILALIAGILALGWLDAERIDGQHIDFTGWRKHIYYLWLAKWCFYILYWFIDTSNPLLDRELPVRIVMLLVDNANSFLLIWAIFLLRYKNESENACFLSHVTKPGGLPWLSHPAVVRFLAKRASVRFLEKPVVVRLLSKKTNVVLSFSFIAVFLFGLISLYTIICVWSTLETACYWHGWLTVVFSVVVVILFGVRMMRGLRQALNVFLVCIFYASLQLTQLVAPKVAASPTAVPYWLYYVSPSFNWLLAGFKWLFAVTVVIGLLGFCEADSGGSCCVVQKLRKRRMIGRLGLWVDGVLGRARGLVDALLAVVRDQEAAKKYFVVMVCGGIVLTLLCFSVYCKRFEPLGIAITIVSGVLTVLGLGIGWIKVMTSEPDFPRYSAWRYGPKP